MSISYSQVSNSELEILKFIWKCEPVSTGTITNEMEKCNNWHPSTSKTLIKRLVDKKIIDYATLNSRRCYSSIISERDFINSELERILKGMTETGIIEIDNFLTRKKWRNCMITKFNIYGMSCASCAARIEKNR